MTVESGGGYIGNIAKKLLKTADLEAGGDKSVSARVIFSSAKAMD